MEPRHAFVSVIGAMASDADLFQVVQALRASGRCPNFLHRWHEQSDQNRDYGDDHQQLDQWERPTAGFVHGLFLDTLAKPEINLVPANNVPVATWFDVSTGS